MFVFVCVNLTFYFVQEVAKFRGECGAQMVMLDLYDDGAQQLLYASRFLFLSLSLYCVLFSFSSPCCVAAQRARRPRTSP